MKPLVAYFILVIFVAIFIRESRALNSLQDQAASLNASLTSSGYFTGGGELVAGGTVIYVGDVYDGVITCTHLSF